MESQNTTVHLILSYVLAFGILPIEHWRLFSNNRGVHIFQQMQICKYCPAENERQTAGQVGVTLGKPQIQKQRRSSLLVNIMLVEIRRSKFLVWESNCDDSGNSNCYGNCQYYEISFTLKTCSLQLRNLTNRNVLEKEYFKKSADYSWQPCCHGICNNLGEFVSR